MSSTITARVRAAPATRSVPARAIDLGQAAVTITTIADATMEVRRVHYHRGTQVGAEAVAADTLRVPVFTGPVARIRVEGSTTQNLGNYNSVRVSVSLELPCYPELSEIQRGYTFAADTVDNMLGLELERATTLFSGRNTHG